jgi:hypothetical protein
MRGLAFLAALEERLECFVHSLECILQHLGIDLFVLWSDLFDLGELGRLVIVGDPDTAHPVVLAALGEGCIVQLAIAVKCELQSSRLFACGIDAILKSFLHGSHSFLEYGWIIASMSIYTYS